MDDFVIITEYQIWWQSHRVTRSQLGCDVVTVRAVAYNLHHFYPRQSIQRALVPCGWGHYILEE